MEDSIRRDDFVALGVISGTSQLSDEDSDGSPSNINPTLFYY